MLELYVIDDNSAVSCGEVLCIGSDIAPPPNDFDVFLRHLIPAPTKNTALSVPKLKGGINSVFGKKLQSMDVARLAIGWLDGSDAPTIEGGEFVIPTNRSFITVTAICKSITERLTEFGFISTFHLDTSLDYQRYLSGESISSELGITQHKKV